MVSILISLLVFIVSLGVLVMIHELGHFLTAKFFKVRVEEFGFGLPPRVFGRKRGDTIYSINAIPAGGFVKLTGEDQEVDDPRSFSRQAGWKRAIIIIAGVTMNFFLAMVLFTVIYSVGGPINSERVLVQGVAQDSPAFAAGLKPGDYITRVNGQKVIDPKTLSGLVKQKAGTQISLTFTRDGVETTSNVTPRLNPPAGEGAMGVATLPDIVIKQFPIWQAPIIGTQQAFSLTGQMLSGLGTMVTDLVIRHHAPEDVGGIIRIGYMTHKATEAGWQSVFMWVGLLSLNLALLNILPLPALDGGRLLFVTIETVFRRKVPARIESFIHATGFALLLLMVLLVTYNDLIWVWTNTSLKDKLQLLIPH